MVVINEGWWLWQTKTVVLVEEFTRSVSTEIRVHLDEQTGADLKSAAVLAEVYALTHKKSILSHKLYRAKSHWSGPIGGKLQAKSSNDEKESSPKVANDKPDKGKTEQKIF